MPRNGSGTASIINSFTPLTTADANAVNSNFTDVADMLTGSLPRDGQAGMTGPFLATSGTVGEPGISWNADPDTGIRRPAGDQQAVVCGGADVATFSSDGVAVSIAPTADEHLTNKEYVDGVVPAATSLVPSGSVTMFASSTVPSGWLECNGAAVSRTTYAALFAVVGTTWGTGDGSTTFNVPDLRGEFVRGWDHGKGTDSGRAFASSQLDALQNITGSFQMRRRSAGADNILSPTGVFSAGTDGAVSATTENNADLRPIQTVDFDASDVARTSTETRPRNFALMYIIKT